MPEITQHVLIKKALNTFRASKIHIQGSSSITTGVLLL